MSLKTRSQRMAADVHARVSGIKKDRNNSEAARKEYGALAHKLPVLIRTAGLAQALAFVEASKKAMHGKLLEHLSRTVTGGGDDLAGLCRRETTSMQEYMRLTRDALEALLWYKRFAQSVLGVASGADDVATAEEARAAVGAEGGV